MEPLDMTQALTEISARHWDFVTQENLTAREAVAYLMSGMQVRTFPDMLKKVCGDVTESQLIAGLIPLTNMPPDSLRRKIRNWMNGKNLPTERENIFQICFALELSLDQSERLLTMLTDRGIHYRDRHEVVYAYCLRYGLDYGYAQFLLQQLHPQAENSKSHADPMTGFIRQEFQSVRVQEDLFSFLARNQSHMGSHHNTAYSYFCKMLDLLTGEAIEGERDYSMEYVAQTYLRLNVPREKRTAGYTDIQKMVKRYWPGARNIKAMKNRSEDVSRKTLLLLYLVTGGIWDGDYDELDETYIQPKEFLEVHCKRMNHMLDQCGMGRIDPRNVFDYLVLYCLRPEDKLFMSDQMAALAAEIFGEAAENTGR